MTKENKRSHTNDFPKTKPFKDTLAYEGIKRIWKIATKNMIPSDPEKIMEMEKRLIKEEQIKDDVHKAKVHIKEIFKKRNEAYREIKRQRRMKLRKILHIENLVLTNKQMVLLYFIPIVIIILGAVSIYFHYVNITTGTLLILFGLLSSVLIKKLFGKK